MATLVCAALMVDDPDRALDEAREAKAGGADLVEFRVDGFFTGGRDWEPAGEAGDAASADEAGIEFEIRQLGRLVAESPLPCIVTCRPVSEGGLYDGDEAARLALFERLCMATGEGAHPPRFIDVELATLTNSAEARRRITLAIDHPEQVRDVKTSLMVSLHDFAGRPADLSRQMLRMQRETAAKVLKVAYRARSIRDNLDLFELLASRDRPMVALGMGEFGLMSRVLAAKFGAFLTFAGVRGQNTTAPGQPSLRELLDVYRFRAVGAATKVYGVIGYPVVQSLSPLVHNAGFGAAGFDAVYVPLPVVGAEDGGAGGYESLKATVLEMIDSPLLDFAGASITRPHKENLVRLAREMDWELDEVSAAAGAGNTLTVQRLAGEGVPRVKVTNTDAAALVEGVREAAGELRGKRLCVLGAGGLARCAALALVREGAEVVVCARRREAAEEVAGVAGGGASAREWEERGSLGCEVYINCTPLGMAGMEVAEASPLSAEDLGRMKAKTVIVETVYNPVETPLLRAARGAGLRTVDGATMFVRQAAAQFSGWTGAMPPLALFEQIVRERLAG